MQAIDRIDSRGNIREHLTIDGQKTVCGLDIDVSQRACGNGLCGRCARIRDARNQHASCQITPVQGVTE